MQETTHQVSSEFSSLSVLNEDCLRHLFKFLQLKDFVHLAETYPWLLSIAKDFCKQIKKIEVLYYDEGDDNCTMQEFSNILSLMGEYVALIKVYPESDILKIIAEKCSNLSSVEVYNNAGTARQGMQMFRNLKELKVGYNINLSTDEWKNYFANNPGIESLEYAADIFYNYDYERKYIPLLYMLPKLKSLKIHAEFRNEIKISHLSCLTSLTKLSFSSDDKDDMCNQLLIELADKLNLVVLEFYMRSYNENSFATLKSFRNLEVFWMRSGYQIRIPEAALFPPMLKHIKLDHFYLSCSVFLSIVKQLKLLKEFVMENDSFIFCENDKTKLSPKRFEAFKDSMIISRIAKELRVEKRKLKIIIIRHRALEEQVFKYSDDLDIIIAPRYFETAFDHTFKI